MWLLEALEFEKLFKSWNHVDVFESFRSDVLSLWIDDLGIDDLENLQPLKRWFHSLNPKVWKFPIPHPNLHSSVHSNNNIT